MDWLSSSSNVSMAHSVKWSARPRRVEGVRRSCTMWFKTFKKKSNITTACFKCRFYATLAYNFSIKTSLSEMKIIILLTVNMWIYDELWEMRLFSWVIHKPFRHADYDVSALSSSSSWWWFDVLKKRFITKCTSQNANVCRTCDNKREGSIVILFLVCRIRICFFVFKQWVFGCSFTLHTKNACDLWYSLKIPFDMVSCMEMGFDIIFMSLFEMFPFMSFVFIFSSHPIDIFACVIFLSIVVQFFRFWLFALFLQFIFVDHLFDCNVPLWLILILSATILTSISIRA